MKIDEITKKISILKKGNKKELSNYYFSYTNSDCDFDVIEGDETIVFCIKENKVYRAFFYSVNEEELRKLLGELPIDTVIDYLSKVENEQHGWIFGSGFKCYSILKRYTDPDIYEKKDKTKRELLLEEYYDENCGEFAAEDDLDEIMTLLYEVFDYRISRLPSRKQLLDMINKNWVLLYRLDGEIVSFYIYNIEGKKIYGYQIYNAVTADITYNLTTKAMNYAKNHYDVKSSYAWIDINNRSANRRNSAKADGLIDYIYVKKKSDSSIPFSNELQQLQTMEGKSLMNIYTNP